jgi:MFS family permease
MHAQSTFAALRHRNFRLWFIGQTLSVVGTWMQSVAQGWVVYELTGSKLALGTVSFLGSVPTLFLMLPAGAIVDRIPRRRLLLITQSATMNTLVQHAVPDALRGRVMALYTLTFFGTAPFGALLAGALAQALGPTGGIAISSSVVLVFALALVITVPRMLRLEAE